MKPWVWVWNAAWRTVRGIRPGWASPDDAWAQARLDGVERTLFERMDPRDRDHAVRVTKTLLRMHPGAPSEVVRASLLHDVGKSRRPYRVEERIYVHLARRDPPPAAPALGGLAGARQVAAHHAEYGAQMLRDAGGDPRVADLIERHERPGDDAQAAWIREADRRT